MRYSTLTQWSHAPQTCRPHLLEHTQCLGPRGMAITGSRYNVLVKILLLQGCSTKGYTVHTRYSASEALHSRAHLFSLGGGSLVCALGPCFDSVMRVTPSFRFERILPKKHNPIKSPKMRLFRLRESGRVAPDREGVKEMSTDTIGSHPTVICPDRG